MRKKVYFFIGVILGMLLFAVFMVWLLAVCWNCTMPYLFGLPTLTFWKAWGLMFVCSMLFKTCALNFKK